MLTIIEAKNPRWASADHAYIDVDVCFEEYEDFGLQPFTTHATADTEHGLELWLKANAGEYGPIAPYVAPEPQPVITILPAVWLWQRMTNEEAAQVEIAMSAQPFRTRQILLTANTFRSDHELWPLLEQVATGLFGAERAAELLTP
ncbi:hypothetical protein OIV19_11945 [Brucella sp. HL-2]|nr:hypothetical protein [Brucella sp. HL-2]MCV9908324.1 hypothetical protein [Brucella sp. HL-2]